MEVNNGIHQWRGWVFEKLNQVSPRGIALLCAILIFLCFAFPLWRIDLYAPQYPEGLSMFIWINKLSGEIENINLLNHYIGMRKIDAMSIPELVYMPKVMGALGVMAFLAFCIGGRKSLGAWYLLFLIAGGVGLWDFYRWEYDYGHNLNPGAPIQIPGMNYQPPLIGSKQILNITSYSLPDIGGWILFTIAILGIIPLLQPIMTKMNFKFISKRSPLIILMALLSLTQSGCWSQDPEPIQIGKEPCHSCKMTISDSKYGAEVILKKGKIMKFDSLDCLLDYSATNQEFISKIYVIDFFSPGHLINAEEAYFSKVSSLHGPMGSTWVTSRNIKKIEDLIKPEKVEILRWSQLQNQNRTTTAKQEL